MKIITTVGFSFNRKHKKLDNSSRISDYYGAAARGRPQSSTGPPNYDMPGGSSHMMSPLQPASGAYNPMVGAAAPPPQYGHPYGPVHPQASTMHGLPPNHVAAAHMHAVHPQAQQQQSNPHMMSVQNGPVILVSNLNEDVSRAKKGITKKREQSFWWLFCFSFDFNFSCLQ